LAKVKGGSSKPTATEIELQLSQRRFILEALSTAAVVAQVPIVTAFIWFYLSKTNVTLGALNKAILAAELTPIVGDIKFPEGVLLGAAMESVDDFLKILDKAGIVDTDDLLAAAREGAKDTGDIAADFVLAMGGGLGGLPAEKMAKASCQELENAAFEARKIAESGRQTGIGWVDAVTKGADTISYGLLLKESKNRGCERPSFVKEEIWLDV